MIAAHAILAAFAFAQAGLLAKRPRAHLPMICLVFALGLIHGVIPILTPEDLRFVKATEASRVVAAWYALAGTIAFVAGYWFHACMRRFSRERQFIDSLQLARQQHLLRYCFWMSIVASLLGMLLVFWSAGVSLLDYVHASRFEFRLDRDVGLAWVGGYLFHLAFAPGFLGHFLSKREQVAGTLFSLVMTAIAFFFLYKGTRHVALGLLGSSLFGYGLCARWSLRRVALVLGIGGTMAFSAVSLYEVRKELGELSIGEAVLKTFSADTLQEPLANDPLNYHEHLIGAIDYFPEEHPYLNGATYRRMLTFFLRGSDYPILKPELPGRVFALVVYNDVHDSAMNPVHPPSLLGDAYINFWGWPGLVVLFLNGAFVSWVTARSLTNIFWLCGLGPHACWFVLLGPRGNPYDYYVMALVMMVLNATMLWRASRRLASGRAPDASSQRHRLPRHRRTLCQP